MTQEQIFWLRFVLCRGLSPALLIRLLQTFDLPECVFDAGERLVAKCIGVDAARQLFCDEIHQRAQRLSQRLTETGTEFLPLASPDYPRAFLRLGLPHLGLFYRGNVSLLGAKSIFVTGTEFPDAEGSLNARNFSYALQTRQLVPLQIGKTGIEQIVRQSAVSAGASITVEQNCLDGSPLSGRELVLSVAETMFGQHSEAICVHLAVALTQTTLIIQAERSQRLYELARVAQDAGQDLMVIPGSIHNTLYKGSHSLLKQGARLVESLRDIVA